MNWYIKESPCKNDNSGKVSFKRFSYEAKAKKNYDKFLREIRAKKQSLTKLKEGTETND